MAKNPAPKSETLKAPKNGKDGRKPSPTGTLPQQRFVPVFSPEDREALQTTLQSALYDMVHLQLVTKQAHWNVVGPNFRSVHLFLDEVWEFVQESTDKAAERLNALGMSPDGQGPEVVANTRVKPIASGFHRDLETIELMCERLHTTSQDLRAGLEPIEDVDTVTADLLHGIIEGLEM
ncbi:DNA starvation/stationary phase protection protein, partial [bacterium]